MSDQATPGHLASAATPGVRLSVILPAYNEGAALPTVLAELHDALEGRDEILVVDDGSTDDTAAVATRHPCRLIRHPSNRGKGAAVRSGIAHARGAYVVVMDADATYPVRAVAEIVDRLAEHDIVRCSRRAGERHMALLNRVGNRLFDSLLARVHGLDGVDHLSGLYGLRRQAILDLGLEAEGFDLEAEIGIKARLAGLRVATFPISYRPRLGETKLRPWRDGLVILQRIATLVVLSNPALTFVYPGLAVMLLAGAGAAALSRGPVITPYFGLSIHSFIVASLGVVVGFQLIVFGMTAALYRMAADRRPRGWLTVASRPAVRSAAGALGLALAAYGAATVLLFTGRWLATGAGAFEQTRALVIAVTLLLFGLQVLSAVLFVSIFASRIERRTGPDPGGASRAG